MLLQKDTATDQTNSGQPVQIAGQKEKLPYQQARPYHPTNKNKQQIYFISVLKTVALGHGNIQPTAQGIDHCIYTGLTRT